MHLPDLLKWFGYGAMMVESQNDLEAIKVTQSQISPKKTASERVFSGELSLLPMSQCFFSDTTSQDEEIGIIHDDLWNDF